MNIPALSSAAASNLATSQTKKKSSLTQEDFLSLLLTQLKFQDPLNPLDNYQMASQVTQLGTAEGINKMNQSMETLTAYQASMAGLQAAGLVGKKVEAMGNFMTLHQGKASEGAYQLARPGNVTVVVYDETGRLVRMIESGWKDASKQRISWDGKDQRGASLPDGTYVFSVKGVDEKGTFIPITSSVMDTVSGVSFGNGVPYIHIGSGKIKLNDILTVLS